MATAEALMTAEEFGQRPDPGYPEELVQGRIVGMPPPDRRHGFVCLKAGRILGNFVDEHDLGRVMSNDSGVITERGPDTVRGADVCYYSYARLPKGPLPRAMGPKCRNSSSKSARQAIVGLRFMRKLRNTWTPAYSWSLSLIPSHKPPTSSDRRPADDAGTRRRIGPSRHPGRLPRSSGAVLGIKPA